MAQYKSKPEEIQSMTTESAAPQKALADPVVADMNEIEVSNSSDFMNLKAAVITPIESVKVLKEEE